MGTIIKEVAILDLTKASEDTLKEIKAIKKVALLLYNEAFEPYIPKVTFEGVATTIKVSGNYTLVNGKTEINKAFALAAPEPLFYIVNGKLTFNPDMTPELVNRVISGLYLNGKMICPENLKASLQQKTTQQNGKVVTYMADATRLENQSLNIDNDYLNQLEDQTNLVVGGGGTLLEEIDLVLFNRKIKKIEFLSKAVISEAYKTALTAKLVGTSSSITYIPQGFTPIEEDLEIDSDQLMQYRDGKLFVHGSVFLKEEIQAEELTKHIKEIKTNESIYCRKELRETVQTLCDPTTSIRTFSGVLRTVSGIHVLTEPELVYTDLPVTYVVNGVLELDPNLNPKTVYEKIEKVDLYGVISGHSEVCGVLQTKLRVNEGVIDSNSKKEPDDSTQEPQEAGDTVISKMAHFKL